MIKKHIYKLLIFLILSSCLFAFPAVPVHADSVRENAEVPALREKIYTTEELQELVDEACGEGVTFIRIIDHTRYGYTLNPKTLELELSSITYPKDPALRSKTVTIVSTISGVKVTGIESSMMIWATGSANRVKGVEKVICPDYVKTIEMRSFEYFVSLKEVVLGKYTKRFVGLTLDPATKKFRDIAYTVQVPADAKYLKTVNGAVYTKDGKTLYYAVPAIRNRSYYKVSKNTTAIAKYAFAGVRSKTIKLPAGLKQISKGAFLYSRNLTVVVPKGQLARYTAMIKKSGVKPANNMKIREAKG